MPRSLWTGTISFGLVSVPVRMFSATESKELLELLRAKAEAEPLPEPKAEEGGEVVDLMAALRESVEKTQKKGSRSRKRAHKAS
jgi:non-homologous end joining protein Ku